MIMAVKCKIKFTAKRLPVEGTEADGTGTCPECLSPDIKLTGKGFVGAHNVKVDVDVTLPITDTGNMVGDPRDAAVRRAVEGRKIAAGSAPVPTSREYEDDAPHGMSGGRRGGAFVKGGDLPPIQPQSGYAASAGTMALKVAPTPRPDKKASQEGIIGGKFGTLTYGQVGKLTATGKREYFRTIATRKARNKLAPR
jgi:hypothetical protein